MADMKRLKRRLLALGAVACLAGLIVMPVSRVCAVPQETATGNPCVSHQESRICYSPDQYPHVLLPDGRQKVVRSMLNIAKPMHFGDFVWNDAYVPQGIVWIRIDLRRQLLSVFRGGNEIGSCVILYGSDGKPTPTGNFSVLQKDAAHYSRTYNAPMPYMLRLTDDGVAIHGSDVREGWATHGCIGVPLAFARLLFVATHKGDLVVINPA